MRVSQNQARITTWGRGATSGNGNTWGRTTSWGRRPYTTWGR
jgi:hypothetical protein